MPDTGVFDVVVCGSLHLDIMVRAPALPRVDETAVGSSWGQVCGGKGGNQAVQAAAAGARTAMLGRVGQDDFGRTLLSNLAKTGVDSTCVTIDTTAGSGMSVAILQDDGDYGAVIVSGANLTFDAAALPAQWSKLGGGKVLVLQNEIPHAINAAIARIARSSGATVVFNAAPARAMGQDLLDLVDVLVVNRVEAEAMAGRPVPNRATASEIISSLAAPQRAVIVTLGGEGLVVAGRQGDVTEIEALPVKVVSTHGAGDCFVGALAARLARGGSLLDSCRFANEQAASFVSRQR